MSSNRESFIETEILHAESVSSLAGSIVRIFESDPGMVEPGSKSNYQASVRAIFRELKLWEHHHRTNLYSSGIIENE